MPKYSSEDASDTPRCQSSTNFINGGDVVSCGVNVIIVKKYSKRGLNSSGMQCTDLNVGHLSLISDEQTRGWFEMARRVRRDSNLDELVHHPLELADAVFGNAVSINLAGSSILPQ